MPPVGVEPTLPQRELDFESSASANSATEALFWLKGGNRIWTDDEGFADLCLTTWLYHQLVILTNQNDQL